MLTSYIIIIIIIIITTTTIVPFMEPGPSWGPNRSKRSQEILHILRNQNVQNCSQMPATYP
jgi:hypothetical protein